MLSRDDESFLHWTAMDADQFALQLTEVDTDGAFWRRFSPEQYQLVWRRAMEYVEQDPDLNGTRMEEHGFGMTWKNVNCYHVSMGMLMGALYCDWGDLKPGPKP